jgi:nicotinamidase-related amidase
MSSALLVMDVQTGVVARFADDPALLERLAGAVAAARAHSVEVIYVRVAFRPGQPEIAISNKSFSALAAASGTAMDESAPTTQIHPAVAPLPGEVIVTKRRVSAFAGSDLAEVLRGRGVDQLVLTGIATSGVVLSTLRLAADLDYRLVVLSDGCADGDPEVHRVLTEKVFPRQADVMTVADWVASLDRPL